MSYVTNVMVSVNWIDDDKFRQLNETFDRGFQFADIAGWDSGRESSPCEFWGGTKFPEVTLWAGAFNYWHEDEVMATIATHAWAEPTHVQVFTFYEASYVWTVRRLTAGREWVTWSQT